MIRWPGRLIEQRRKLPGRVGRRLSPEIAAEPRLIGRGSAVRCCCQLPLVGVALEVGVGLDVGAVPVESGELVDVPAFLAAM
jgi:hypothetical protein